MESKLLFIHNQRDYSNSLQIRLQPKNEENHPRNSLKLTAFLQSKFEKTNNQPLLLGETKTIRTNKTVRRMQHEIDHHG